MSTVVFGQFIVRASQMFYKSSSGLSHCFVNLKPVVPLHVLVTPVRRTSRFSELTKEEVCDMWMTAQHVGTKLEQHAKASSLTYVIQDGPESGQTVDHVHIHIIPRRRHDFERGSDQIYEEIEKEREARTEEEMAAEANLLRELFAGSVKVEDSDENHEMKVE